MSDYLFTPEDDAKLLRETLDQVLCTLDDPENPYYSEMRQRAAQRLAEVRDRLNGVSDSGYGRVKKTLCRADRYLHHKPWQSIGISAAAAIAVGFILGRCTQADQSVDN